MLERVSRAGSGRGSRWGSRRGSRRQMADFRIPEESLHQDRRATLEENLVSLDACSPQMRWQRHLGRATSLSLVMHLATLQLAQYLLALLYPDIVL
jgi:hypothetical protein